MKRKKYICILSLVLSLGLTACSARPPFLFRGNSKMESFLDSLETAAKGQSSPESRESSENTSSMHSEKSSETESGTFSSENLSWDLDDSLSSVSDWYDSENCKFTTKMLQAAYGDVLDFYFEVEEPGVIIYNYQYKEPVDIDDAVLQAYFDTQLDKESETFVDSIKGFRDTNKVYVTAVRINYFNQDGTLLYTKDFTDDYVPGQTATQPLLPKYDSLEAWLASPEKELIVETINRQYDGTITTDFLADGNTLIMNYTYVDQLDCSDLSEEDLKALYEAMMTPEFLDSISSIYQSFEDSYDLTLDDIQIIYRNADGTILYSFFQSDLAD